MAAKTAEGQAKIATVKKTQGKQWEYLVVDPWGRSMHFKSEDSQTSFLNEFGEQGWELVGVVTDIAEAGTHGTMYYFKREKKSR
ncbi:MAG: DUF4177 domain-containing protein [Patescibacteria group bacterium]